MEISKDHINLLSAENTKFNKYLTEEELINGNKTGSHTAKKNYLLYRNILCKCPHRPFDFNVKRSLFLNIIGASEIKKATAELEIPIGTTMLRYGYKYIPYLINYSSMQYEKLNKVMEHVYPDIKVSKAIVKRRIDYDNGSEIPEECECYEEPYNYFNNEPEYYYNNNYRRNIKKYSKDQIMEISNFKSETTLVKEDISGVFMPNK